MSVILAGAGENVPVPEPLERFSPLSGLQPLTEQDKTVLRVLHRLLATMKDPGSINVDALRSHIEENLFEKKAISYPEEVAIVEKLVNLPIIPKDMNCVDGATQIEYRKTVGWGDVTSVDLDRCQADIDALRHITLPKFKGSLLDDLQQIGLAIIHDHKAINVHADLAYEIQRINVELTTTRDKMSLLREQMKTTMRYVGGASVFLEELKACMEDIAIGIERQLEAKCLPSADSLSIYTEICSLLKRESKIEKTDDRNIEGSPSKDTTSV